MEKEFYRPEHVEFNVTPDNSGMPESLGEFATGDDVIKFITKNFTFTSQPMTVARHMDQKEKMELRAEYANVMEEQLPVYETQLTEAERALTDAKKEQKSAEEGYNFIISKAKSLASEVKRGLKDMPLD